MKLDFVSLFAGSGGLDLGLEMAGWECRYASDIDDSAVSTLRANQEAGNAFTGTYIERADVTRLNGRDILAAAGMSRGSVPLLAGGPPCQSWSSAGHQLGFDDPRGRLWSDFVRLAGELDTRWLLFENVRGLLTARGEDGVPGSALRTIRAKLLDAGFHTTVSLLNSADYGVPQRRVRLFIIGYREGDEPQFPEPSHRKAGAEAPLLGSNDLPAWVSLDEALSRIDPVRESEVIRPSGKMAEELRDLPPGTGAKSMGKTEATRPGGHWGYKQGAFVTDPRVPARTVTAGPQQDWIRDPLHGLRRLTPRECAAIQTYPSDYVWPVKASDQYRLVGNSVPPRLAQVIGIELAKTVSAFKPAKEAVKAAVLAPLPPKLQAAIAYTMREERANGGSRRAAPPRRRVRLAV